jgi:hypothetical protein
MADQNREILNMLFQVLARDKKFPLLQTLEDREAFKRVIEDLVILLQQLKITLNPQEMEKNKMIIGLAFQALFAAEKAGPKADLQLVRNLIDQIKLLLLQIQTPEEKLKNDGQSREDFTLKYTLVFNLTRELQKTLDPALQLELDKTLKELETMLDRLNIPRPSMQPDDNKMEQKPKSTKSAWAVDKDGAMIAVSEADSSAASMKAGGITILQLIVDSVETREQEIESGHRKQRKPWDIPEFRPPGSQGSGS